ncbi:extracellular solute-binding protein [Ochrobactrum quorumnocens]|uniref:ABC transporter substrate-binding protein n=1 Tax=Ochrobactrum quorumnocens TaxID=271865 RepID=A0A5N1JWJ8_9HYPH|nr:extracellular solute-binding protein [[Ochrobactrum] quorumnocens]KAA9366641.1 ABC transporter substrate-binding protein [[Ochrobactrum] quorumnocens]MBD7992530.1 ABC transporter substrate-binding protein [Ochrobactrum gallinarum]
MSGFHLNRRHFLGLSGSAALAACFPEIAFAKLPTDKPLHGLSAFGELKYPPDFAHFDYVNPDAPKGGTFTLAPSTWVWNQNTETFNTLNTLTFKGDAPPRMELTFDTLMVSALDEPDAVYGLIAENVTLSKDHQTCLFKLRKEARFHDGSPIEAKDVVFTYETLKEKGHPQLRQILAALEAVKEISEREVQMHFSAESGPNAILDAVTLPILSKDWFKERNFDATGLEPILGSGAYRVGKVSAGQAIEYDRVDDYWAKDLPVQRGSSNFGRIRIEFYRDRQPEFEAFKKGNIDFRSENVAKNWATAYDFPAIQQNKIIKRTFPREKRPLMQAWAINQRRERFSDPRVREAINLCFDFEWTNANLFYDTYQRSQSNFNGSDFQAVGMPTADELKVLERFRGKIPEAAFGEVPVMPVSDGTGRDRKQFSRAIELMEAAGFERNKGQFHGKNGEKFTLEILSNSESLNRVYNPLVQKMRAIGIDASVRLVDPSQYQARMQDFDFDLVGIAMQFGATPTKESLAGMFGSESAKTPGSYNLPGTSDPIIDALIEDVGKASTRDELVATIRVLDRYLRIRLEWIPNWTVANHLVAYWDRFGFKEPKPDYGFPVETLWWIKA